ncbi:MAG TPA: ABC transporter ATP-binding protein, partial [Thermoplasmataceae archaeon]|nr:ABC transporter ATP-binding protein [Thermoplasmataceae archaeon]
MAFVEIRNLVRHYSGNFKLYNISLELERGETLTLMGPSGSGKTSLLRNVCGLDIPDSGRITVGGRDITYLPTTKRNIGLIFQDLAIFPHMKVYDNIAYGLRAKNVHERDIEERVEELSGMLGIKSLLERFPGQISGGQRQRVALARSVAPSPSVLLLDEPMSSLDMQLRSSVRSEIKSFAKKMELT